MTAKTTHCILDLPKFVDPRGNLTFIESNNQIPFTIERVYWIYDVPGGEIRGGHAFRKTKELVIALSGSFDLVLHDGYSEQRYHLNRSYYGVYVPNMIWRKMENFSTNSTALLLASTNYDPDDYIRDFEQFETVVRNSSNDN
jgi:dTDP-4-dehydrorhamnose 3,5-epimerase-like enzyme